jgi:hypothetical protein
MRRIIYLSLAVLSAVLVPLELSKTNASTPSVPNLRGTCIWQEFKYPTTISDQQGLGPASVLASIHFGESGAMTMDYDANVNGIYSSTNGVSGSYSVDSTGHGSFSFLSPATTYFRTYDFRVSPNGHTIYTMAKQDGTSIGDLGPTQRVSTGSCTFQEEDENRSGQHDSVLFPGR